MDHYGGFLLIRNIWEDLSSTDDNSIKVINRNLKKINNKYNFKESLLNFWITCSVMTNGTEIDEIYRLEYADYYLLYTDNIKKLFINDITTNEISNLIDLEEDNNCVIISDTKLTDERFYDIHIIYDMYFNTPRIYLFGYNNNNDPLTYTRMLDDVQQEYVSNTLTLEKHPHIDLMCLSLHPCKHAITMKNLINNIENFQKDLYLVLFIKIISSLIPKLDYDMISIDF